MHVYVRVQVYVWLTLVVYPSVPFCFIVTKIA